MSEEVADTAEITDLEMQLDALDRHGYLLVRNALDEETVQAWRASLQRKYEREEWDISNEVGNVAFDHLLAQEPELARPMVGHPSVAPYLKAMLGRQCQLRSFRAHINPGAYTQEWHKDFGYYWAGPLPARFCGAGAADDGDGDYPACCSPFPTGSRSGPDHGSQS